MRPPSLKVFFPVLLACAASLGCRGRVETFPLSLLARPSAAGRVPSSATVTVGPESRPAVLESATYRLRLPRRGLLTFGLGTAYAGSGEAPGWFRFRLLRDGAVLHERAVNPRATHGWTDVSVPLEGPGDASLSFELRFTDRDGRDVPKPAEMILAVSEPMFHDLDAYGRSRGVILVSIDTVRRDHVGLYGYSRPTTPRLDAFARDGIVCDDAVSVSSWTLPAHLSLLTSADPGVHGGVDMHHGFNRRVPTLPAILRGQGYATRAVTSHLYVSAVYGLDEGFDFLDYRQDRVATDVAEHAIDALDRMGDRPFFLFLHLYDPHWHYAPPEADRRLFETSYAGNLTGIWQDFSRRDPRSLKPADLEHLRSLYDGEIHYADREVGRVLDHLEARGLGASTLVIVTSDHGEEFLDHGSWEHQKTVYEEVIRIPLVLAGPGLRPRREAAQVSLLDVAPTILDWLRLPPAPSFAGRSLLGSLGDREAYGETDHTLDRLPKLFLRAGAARWKVVLSLDASRREARREEWYDLSKDPREAGSHAPSADVADPIRRRAIERFRSGRERGRGAPAVNLSDEQKERLKALGYVNP